MLRPLVPDSRLPSQSWMSNRHKPKITLQACLPSKGHVELVDLMVYNIINISASIRVRVMSEYILRQVSIFKEDMIRLRTRMRL